MKKKSLTGKRWSRLTQVIIPVLDRIAPAPLSDDDRDLLEAIVEDHGLEGASPPGWMVALFDDILVHRLDTSGRLVPQGYPHGEDGLANVLADIERDLLPLGRDDYGEGMDWPIPACGVRVFISREALDPSGGNGTRVHLRAC